MFWDVSPISRHQKVSTSFPSHIIHFPWLIFRFLRGAKALRNFSFGDGRNHCGCGASSGPRPAIPIHIKADFSAPRTRDNCPELAQAFLRSKIFVFLIILYVGNHLPFFSIQSIILAIGAHHQLDNIRARHLGTIPYLVKLVVRSEKNIEGLVLLMLILSLAFISCSF